MNIIGQKNLLHTFQQEIENGFPLFTIIYGYRGGGKKLIAHKVAQDLGGVVVDCGITVADVRTVIENSYKTRTKTVYILADADKMSNEAKSALLKVTEEPPNNSYFIMTLQTLSAMPATILSRASIHCLDRYTPAELAVYCEEVDVDKVVCDFCDTPGDVDIFKECEVGQFLDYVNLVFDNIAEVGTANSLKIGDRIALKESGQGYDLKLFWKAFVRICMNNAMQTKEMEQALEFAAGAAITSKYLAELNIRGVNKNMLFLDWVLQLRKEWA